MSDWAPKRFWTNATAVAAGDGFEVRLDDRPVRTPAKTPLVVPTEALAAAMAAEWDRQGERIEPATMPLTRLANSAVDTVRLHPDALVDQIAAYGESDLLCYRVEAPAELAARQAAAWDPLLAWARSRFGAALVQGVGVMFVPQPAPSLAALRAEVARHDHFGLAALHELTTLTGSLVIALAVVYRFRPDAELWAASRLDETWQAEQWGEDAEAAATATRKAEAFADAAQFYRLRLPD